MDLPFVCVPAIYPRPPTGHTAPSAKFRGVAAETRSFADLVDSFVDEDLANNPTKATALGDTSHDLELPDLTAAGQQARRARDEHWLRTFTEYDASLLSPAESVDRELACSALRGRAVDDDWESWRRTPESYLGAVLSGVHLLFAHRLRPEPELAAAVIARLDGAADVLAAGR
ncbi:MAG: hypothetical protein QOF57_1585, partial [Frankiaceae bacterium]|nr:hypothetical protein [Frankiaceae bacterium]